MNLIAEKELKLFRCIMGCFSFLSESAREKNRVSSRSFHVCNPELLFGCAFRCV